LIADFETAAFEAATRHGARVVKTIGDEVMLCADEPAAVCRAALELVAYCHHHDTLSAARGGVAAGDLLEQDGDCYGPVVNRAARFVQAADDGVVMVDAAVAARIGAELAVIDAEPVTHRGLGAVPWFRLPHPLTRRPRGRGSRGHRGVRLGQQHQRNRTSRTAPPGPHPQDRIGRASVDHMGGGRPPGSRPPRPSPPWSRR
jgi:class 3 adenylate cyclase